VILFALGIAAGRRGWLETLTPRLRRRCGLVGVVTAVAFPAVLLAGGFSDGGVAENRFAGGWHWPAAAGALLEGLLATCVSVWALGHFRARQGRHSPPLVTALARRRILDHRGETLADADAHGGDSVASAAAA
jgi:hypothetical protein